MARTVSAAAAVMSALLLTLSAVVAATSPSHLQARDYVDQVCKPKTLHASDTVPPCVEIETIETLCAPNGTDPVDYAAHAECLCGGSYFAEWDGCQACLQLHGQRSEQQEGFYLAVASAASHSLCDFLTDSSATTPTAAFASLFASAAYTVSTPSTGATAASDAAPSDTAVSLYYTATAAQGPGAITGAAASATRTPTESSGGSTSETGPASETGPISSETGAASSAAVTGGSGTTVSAAAGTGASTTKASGSGAGSARGVAEGLVVGAVALAVAAALH